MCSVMMNVVLSGWLERYCLYEVGKTEMKGPNTDMKLLYMALPEFVIFQTL